jgi:signal transduction histidine kinase
MNDYMAFLKGVGFFKHLSENDIHKINQVCKEVRFNDEEIVFVEGSLAERFYIVIEGEVEVWKDYYSEKRDLLAVHGKGQMFGEMALLDGLPRSATVISRAMTRLLYIDRADFNRMVIENSSISLSIAQSVSSLIRKSNEHFVENLRQRNIQLEKSNQELKAAQEELLRSARLSAVGKFSSIILHDIRNPLCVLRGYAELIRERPHETKAVVGRAEKIIKEANRINELANELLDYTHGEIKLDSAVVDVQDFLLSFIQQISDSFKDQGIDVKSEIAGGILAIMDRRRMLRVLHNLAANAKKAMIDGGTLTIRTSRKGNYLRIDVSDTGIGMSPRTQKQIFEPFFSSFQQGGTGLGMTIVKNIVEAHQGYIRLESKEHEGTQISVYLPGVEE